ncbi:Helix-turn-helix domain protein [compost metagenome]
MAYTVKVDVSPVYELLGSFLVHIVRKWTNNIDMGPEWIDTINSRLNETTRAAFAEAASWPFEDYDVLYAWAVERGELNQIEEYLNFLQTTSSEALCDKIRSYIPEMTAEKALLIRNNYVPLLHIWYDVYFKEIESMYVPLLEEDAAEKLTLLDKMDPESLIDYASGGLIVSDELPVEQVILLPIIHLRPINTYCFYNNMLLIQYPVDLPLEDANEAPNYLLRLTRALAAPERLRMLRYLANEPKSLPEMQQFLNESEETLMYHLRLLRVAGLLRVHLGTNDQEKFCFRPDGISELQIFLETYIQI